MNLHRFRLAWILCLYPIVLAGCSTTVGSRLGGSSQAKSQPEAKSITVSGDRNVSVAAGDPGSQVVVAADPEPKLNPKGRISGKVLDDQGDPVPNVTVRLADGGTKGGKDIRATTDKTGAFSLNGLRPGSSYTLIAEAEDDKGPLSGRVKAKSSDSRVEITLLSEEAEQKAATRARPAKARPISSREDVEEEPALEGKPAINREDVGTRSDQPEGIDPGPAPGADDQGKPRLETPVATNGWQNTKTVKKTRPRATDSDAVATSAEDAPRRSRIVTVSPGEEEDEEGPNPLPPAIEPSQADEPAPRKPTSARIKPAVKPVKKPAPRQPDSGDLELAPETSAVDKPEARRTPEPSPVANLASTELPPLAPVATGAAEIPSALPEIPTRPEPQVPGPLAEVTVPPDLPPVNGDSGLPTLAEAPPGPPPSNAPINHDAAPTIPASQPVFASQAPDTTAPPAAPVKPTEYNPFALVAASAASEPAPSADSLNKLDREPTRTTASLPAEVEALTAAADQPSAPAAAAPKTRWGDLTLAPTAAKPAQKIQVEPTKASFTSSLVKRLRPAPASAPATAKVDASIAQCTYDARLRKMKDFRLPDLEGKPVRFQDLNADFVLLDFWGTWCTPCLESIPHLIELQKKYGQKRLKVVGIACEELPADQRKAKVEEVSRQFGINYTILLSTMDGKPCPVQQALAVQAMPTMILLNRKGEVIWRSIGSTVANESRLDRVLASHMNGTETAKR